MQGTFVTKLANRMQCEFYRLVLKQEGKQFVQSTEILKRMAARTMKT